MLSEHRNRALFFALFSALISGCGSNQPAQNQLQVWDQGQQEATAWQNCQKATAAYTCESFIASYPNSMFRAGAEQKLQQFRQLASQQRAAVEQKNQEAKFERDKQLPVDVRRDKYMVALTTHLKNERYQESMLYFQWLERLETKLAPSFNYFYGEALLKLNKPNSAIKKLYAYIKEVGSKGKYYKKALELANEAESMEMEEESSLGNNDSSPCPNGPAQLSASMPNVIPLQAPGTTVQHLLCRYGDKGEYVIEATYSTGNREAACRDPQQNPRLVQGYQPHPLIVHQPQAVPIFGFGFQDVAGTNGVAVHQVMLGLAAEKAGLQAGDLIIAINGDKKAASDQKRAQEAFAKLNSAQLTIRRYGNIMVLNMDKAMSITPKVAVLHTTNILAMVKVTAPSNISDGPMQQWVDSGKVLLNSISGSAISPCVRVVVA